MPNPNLIQEREEKQIYCVGCSKDVFARLTDGSEIYPHRKDLHELPFWICDTCRNYVGCHHKTTERTRPLGVIPTKEVMEARKRVHAILDPLWKSGKVKRNKIYQFISKKMGKPYHTGFIKSVEEVDHSIAIIKEYKDTLQ